MAQFRNRNNTLCSVTIDGFTDFKVVGCSINTDDISSCIFSQIITSALSLTILTSDDDIYTGSLIGKSVTLTIGQQTRNYTIVTNVADMSANYASEEVQIEAIDALTLTKNQRYNVTGYKSVKGILRDILGEYWLLGGWGGTDVLDIAIDIDIMREDNGQTAPYKYDVIQALCTYINRSIYYDYNNSVYVVYATNSTSRDGIHVTANSETEGTLESHFDVVSINGTSIAAADRRISLEDSWQSAKVTAKFEDIKFDAVKPSYADTLDSGKMYIYSNNMAAWQAYWAVQGAHRYYESDEGSTGYMPATPTTSMSINTMKRETEPQQYFGGQPIAMAASLTDDRDEVEGSASITEQIILYGLNRDQMTWGGMDDTLYDYTINTSVLSTTNLYLIVSQNVTFSRYPLPLDEGTAGVGGGYWCRRMRVKIYTADGLYVTRYLLVGIIDNMRQAEKIERGRSYATSNNVYWKTQLDTSGYLVPLFNKTGDIHNITGKIITKIEIGLYCGVVSSDRQNLIRIPTNYEFVTLSASIEHQLSINADLFTTDTVYKWNNTDASAVVCSGNEQEETPKYVTYDGKRGGNNCAVRGTAYCGKLSDEFAYTDEDECESEARRINDIGAQYATSTFGENVTIKGLHWFNEVFIDEYFEKNCIATSMTLDVVEATTNITLKHIKQWDILSTTQLQSL